MSRIANSPVALPDGVEVKINGNTMTIKGKQGTIDHLIHPAVKVVEEEKMLKFTTANESDASAIPHAGTTRAIVNSKVLGVSEGIERKLILKGVGYRAQTQGNKLNLTLGFSHPVEFAIPEGIKIETPSQTEILVKGVDKQQVGQVAAKIRSLRPPEPYKGKGVRYADERVVLKEAKKK